MKAATENAIWKPKRKGLEEATFTDTLISYFSLQLQENKFLFVKLPSQ
jgi:hypothetical protein